MADLETALGETPETPEPEAIAPEPKQEATEPETVAEPTPEPEPGKKEEHQVPLPVFMEMKNEVKALKAELQKQNAPAPPAPPEFIDPEGATYLQQQVNLATQNVKLDLSEEHARQRHGDDVVDAAFQALQAAQDPSAHNSIMSARSPYEALVKWHKAQTVAQEIGTDPDAYRKKIVAEVRAEIEAEMATKQVKEMAAKAAPSLANVTGTGGGPKTAYAGPTPLDAILGE